MKTAYVPSVPLDLSLSRFPCSMEGLGIFQLLVHLSSNPNNLFLRDPFTNVDGVRHHEITVPCQIFLNKRTRDSFEVTRFVVFTDTNLKVKQNISHRIPFYHREILVWLQFEQ